MEALVEGAPAPLLLGVGAGGGTATIVGGTDRARWTVLDSVQTPEGLAWPTLARYPL